MFKPKKLLKVVSIILIVFSAIGMVSLVLGYIGMQSLSQMEGIDASLMETVNAAYTPLNLAIGFGGCILSIACGILGITGKSFKAALWLMVVYIIISLVSTVMSGITMSGIGLLGVMLDFLFPVLYLWGLYQSKE